MQTDPQLPPPNTMAQPHQHLSPDAIYPFDACSGVKAQAAAASRIFLTVSIGWASAWRLVRIVGRPFGYSLDLMKER